MIDALRNKLAHALAYVSTSLGTESLADKTRFPTELDEPMTTLWEWEDEQRKLKGPKE